MFVRWTFKLIGTNFWFTIFVMQDILMHLNARVSHLAQEWWLHLLFFGPHSWLCPYNSAEVKQTCVFVKDGSAGTGTIAHPPSLTCPKKTGVKRAERKGVVSLGKKEKFAI